MCLIKSGLYNDKLICYLNSSIKMIITIVIIIIIVIEMIQIQQVGSKKGEVFILRHHFYGISYDMYADRVLETPISSNALTDGIIPCLWHRYLGYYKRP